LATSCPHRTSVTEEDLRPARKTAEAGSPRIPPGPKGFRPYYTLRRLLGFRDFIEGLNRKYGDVVFYRRPFVNCCLLFDPELSRRIQLAQRRDGPGTEQKTAGTGTEGRAGRTEHSPVFVKNHHESQFLKTRGLNTADGEPHQRMVRLVSPAFQRTRLNAFAEVMIEEILAAQARLLPGRKFLCQPEMIRLSARVILRFCVGSDMKVHPDMVTDALRGIKWDLLLFHLPFSSTLRKLPIPENVRARQSVKRVEDLIFESVRRARESGPERSDPVSRMVHARDEQRDEPAFTDDEIRDITIDLMLASTEPLRDALTRSIDCISRYAEVRSRLEREVDEVLGDRPISPEDYERLRYTRAILQEALRFGPPAFVAERTSLEDYILGDYFLPKGTKVQMVMGTPHFDEQYWRDPTEFRPERWLGEHGTVPPGHIYAPFNYSPHLCLGWELATMTVVYFLASMAQRLRLDPVKPVGDDFKFFFSLKGPAPTVVSERK